MFFGVDLSTHCIHTTQTERLQAWEKVMFEHSPEEQVAELKEIDPKFKRLCKKHAELDSETAKRPQDIALKKQKLKVRDAAEQILSNFITGQQCQAA